MSSKQPVSLSELLKASDERDELRAEVERLKAAVDMVAEEREAWKKEAIFLRVGLRETVEAGEAWKAEVERLKADLEVKDEVQSWRVEWLAMEAENERLRAALFKIADDSSHADQYVQWAQEALGR